jgi:hypothetical protein
MPSCVRLAPFLSTPQKIPAEWDFSLERLDDAYAIVHRSFGRLRVRGEPLESMGGSWVSMEFDENSRPGKLLSIGDVLIAENVEISNLDVCRSQDCEVCQARWSCDRRNRLIPFRNLTSNIEMGKVR